MTEVQRSAVTGQLFCRRYRLQELVGRGAAAGVYRALDEALGREVALKVFSKEGGEPELLARQDAEIRILASLIHPSLVTLFDAGTDPDTERSFVVMEYVPGPDLRRHLRDGPMDPAEIAKVGSDLAAALDYVHSRGVIHRDLKPGNVLLYNPRPGQPYTHWRAKLADFGIARMMEEDHLTGPGRMVGTAAYLSPEQALGEALNGASDVYSLGLVLLECFTRQVEFPGNQIESGVARLQRSPVIPDSVGAGWKALLTAMTARQPADRPTAAEAANTLQRLALQVDTHAASVTAADIEPTERNVRSTTTPVPPPLPPHPPTVAARQLRKPGKRARAALAASIAAVLLAGGTAATLGGEGTVQSASPAGPAVPVQNNPVDFHLDQLETALKPSPAFQSTLNQVRQAVIKGDLQTALTQLDRLQKAVSDEAVRSGVTLEKYRSITEAIRLVRNDLQTLITASAGPTADAVPAAPGPVPVTTADPVPVSHPLPAPVITVEIPAGAQAGDTPPGEQQDQTTNEEQTTTGGGLDNEKSKAGKPKDHGGGKNKD
ncbi:serine/threonine-protein kinase [Arthrobacter sp. Cr_A7]|uniref:serine/threonine-protein kinase n=1 Tax=Arthrobacter sp. Cr_A7 TaxID=3031017 RepID=UPI0023D98DD4|nr:serine/threonine-protein kinase [Arthrobacter sp. Cr_A7]MDF2048512.1 serine/threonine-protein kinase [Arthrobacter sp. Cr_A7]